MFWAIVNIKKVEPSPKAHGLCPLCNGKVISKCGKINVWHWAHFKNENCDSWQELESYWHFHWKMTFGKENAEVVIRQENKLHIADILTVDKIVIELQNSPIQKDVIRQREEFYGERMMWLVNGINFKHNFFIKDLEDNSHWWGYHHNSTKSKKGKKIFKWEYPHRSWQEVGKYLFIDFGDDDLFWVKEGMGTKSGIGIFVSKEAFIAKYKGDYHYFLSQFSFNTK